ncbi:MAG: hypothetical protein KGN34_07310 [Sphingomonadales bacterium]|nr:hypothetical protein [Sphingomonadales bacterium]
MNKFAPLAAVATLAVFAMVPAAVHAAEASQSVRAAAAEATTVKVTEGKMIYGSNGQRLAPVYRVQADGSVQIILEGRLVTIAASNLTSANGKVATTLTKAALLP